MNELGPAARKLLDETRDADDPGVADARRVRAALFAKIGVTAGAGAGAALIAKGAKAAPVVASGALGGATLVKIGLVVATLGIEGYFGLRAGTHPSSAPPVASISSVSSTSSSPSVVDSTAAAKLVAPSPSTSSETTAPVVPMPLPVAASSAPVAVKSAPVIAPPGATGSTSIADEIALIRSAQQHLAAGDAAAALVELDEHAARFPHGAMAEEREGARLVAHCMLGDAGAVARAEKFLASHGESPIAVRVRSACGLP